jgi:MFS family permease
VSFIPVKDDGDFIEMTNSDFEREVERHYRHNAVVNTLDATFFWLGSSFIAPTTILPLYVSHFTDSRLAIGLLSTLASSWFLLQLFTANWVQRLPRKKVGVVNVGLFTERLPVFFMIPVAMLSIRFPLLSLLLFFVVFAWHMIGAGAIGVSWQDMIAKIIPLDRRGRFFGIANFCGTVAGVLGATTAAWLLDRYEFPRSYVFCFTAAAIFVFASWVFLALTREPAQINHEPAVSQREYWRRLPKILRTNSNFRRYLFSRIVVNLGGMATGFLTVYAVQRWQLPDSQAGYLTTSMLTGQALGHLLFGALSDRRGHKLVLELGTLSGTLAIGLANLATAPAWFYVVFFLTGACTASFMLSGMMITFEFSAPDVRPTYIGLNNTICGVVSAIAPLVGGGLAEVAGYRGMFAVAFWIGLAGFALLRWSVREPRQVQLTVERQDARG